MQRGMVKDDMNVFAMAVDITTLTAEVARLREDAVRLDWLEAELRMGDSIELRRWTHDGRRTLHAIGSGHTTLLVHEFSGRGGTDETVREAIDAATTPPGGPAHAHVWQDARNNVIQSGEFCACGALRAGNESGGPAHGA